MEKLIEELTSQINEVINKAQNEGRVLTPEEEKQLSIYSAKLDLLKKFAPKSAVAPIVMAEKNIYEKTKFNFVNLNSKGDEQTNYVSGLFWLSVLKKDKNAVAELNNIGVKMAMSEGTGSAGGYLVPREMMRRIIELFNEYGAIRQNAFIYPIGTLNNDVPIGSALVTASFVSENASFSASDASFEQQTLTAKKLGVLMVLSKELDQDQVVNLGDYLNRLAARAIAYKEDDTGFNGDGTSGYGSITGLKNALQAGSIYQGTAKKFASMTLDDFYQLIGKVQPYALRNAKWYISPTGFSLGMLKLAGGAGNTFQTYEKGMGPSFLGYPVVISPLLPAGTADATNTILVYFGDLSQALILGDRMSVEVNVSEDRYFEYYQRALLVVERIDMKVFNPGTSSISGAMVAFKTAAT